MDANPRLIQTIVTARLRRGWAIGSQCARAGSGALCWLRCRCFADRAAAQGPTVDTSVPASRRGGLALGPAPGSGSSLLGPAPGAGGGTFNNLPGTGGILGGRPGVSTPKGIPTSISTPGIGAGPTELQMPISSPQPAPVSPPRHRSTGRWKSRRRDTTDRPTA